MDEREAFENAYSHYVHMVEALAGSPEEACKIYGHFNVAYGIKRDVELVPPIFEWAISPLTAEHRRGIANLISALQLIPEQVLSFTNVKQECLARMRHPSWLPARKMANQLLQDLRPITELNNRYFEQDARET